MTRHLHTNRIQTHTFLIFMKPSFWATLAWFCIDFTSPGIRTFMQKRPKSLPRRSKTKFQEKLTHDLVFDEKLTNVRSKCTPKVPQNPYKSSPGPPWDSKVAQAIPESCPKPKRVCSGHENGPQCSKQTYHARLTNVSEDAKKTRRASKGGIASESSSRHRGAPGENKFKGRRHEASAI